MLLGQLAAGDKPFIQLARHEPAVPDRSGRLIGRWGSKAWLSRYEIRLSVFLLLIPYITQASRGRMSAQGRYASVVFAMYIVLGHLLARLPGPTTAVMMGLSAFFLAAYSAMFASWYWFY